MGKQLSMYLDEYDCKRLNDIAIRECRRPVDQVRWLLRQALMQYCDESQSQAQPDGNNG